MPKSNLANLQAALSKPKAAPAPAKTRRATTPSPQAPPTFYKAPSREGKANITAYLSPDYKSNLRLIQAQTGTSLQTLIAEALNDLFQKYDVPTIEGE